MAYKYFRNVWEKSRFRAFIKAQRLRKKPCSACGLFGCICQTSLNDFKNKPKILKNPCLICGFYLCDCPESKNKRGFKI